MTVVSQYNFDGSLRVDFIENDIVIIIIIIIFNCKAQLHRCAQSAVQILRTNAYKTYKT